MSGLRFSICVPTYNAAPVLREAIESILRQSFRDYEIIVGDDNSSDDTEEVVRGFEDPRIRYFRNRDNVGYGRNLRLCSARARYELLFLMGHDDILLRDALMKTRRAFERGPAIGAVTRPYYWFDSDVLTPVRAIRPFDPGRDTVLSIFDSVGQLSGLGYRRKYLDTDFHEENFPSHIYPFASIAKRHRVVYLKDYTVAVRIGTSMTIHRPLNLLDARYWFFGLGTLALPARLLVPLVSRYKKTILSRKLRDIEIEL